MLFYILLKSLLILLYILVLQSLKIMNYAFSYTFENPKPNSSHLFIWCSGFIWHEYYLQNFIY